VRLSSRVSRLRARLSSHVRLSSRVRRFLLLRARPSSHVLRPRVRLSSHVSRLRVRRVLLSSRVRLSLLHGRLSSRVSRLRARRVLLLRLSLLIHVPFLLPPSLLMRKIWYQLTSCRATQSCYRDHSNQASRYAL
jgi:hypothetical protein